MIKAVIFDYGGVIATAQRTEMIFPWCEEHTGLDMATIRAGYDRHRKGFDRDDYSGQEMYRRILVDNGVTPTEALLDKLNELDLLSWSYPNPETYKWAWQLHDAGYKIGILTNMPCCFIHLYNKSAVGFRALADAEVISGAVRMAKPDAEIYNLILEKLGVRAEESVFFDDSRRNVAAALSLGMYSHVFTDVSDAKEYMKTIQL